MTYLRNKERRARRAWTLARRAWLAGQAARREAEQRRVEEQRRHASALVYLDDFKRIHGIENRLVALLTHCVFALNGRGNAVSMMHAMRKVLDDLNAYSWRASIIDDYSRVTGVMSYYLDLRVTSKAETFVIRKPPSEQRGLVDFPNSVGFENVTISGETYATRLSCDPINYERASDIDVVFFHTCREMRTAMKTSRDAALARVTTRVQ